MEDLERCLRCGSEITHGAIVGQHMYLNWEPEGTKPPHVMMTGDRLATGSITRGPRLDAARCESCGMGYFAAISPEED